MEQLAPSIPPPPVARVVAHDLRDAFAALAMHADRLAALAAAPHASHEHVLARARAAAAAIRHTVRRMEELAALLEGAADVRRELVDLRAMAHEAVEFHGLLAEARGLTIRASASVPTLILGDRARLWQALANLVSNALRHTPAGGAVEVAVTTSHARARVAVRDTGVGVDAARLAGLLERSGASGLGLQLVRAIVERHAGEVGAASEPGRGSVFWFELPLPNPADRVWSAPAPRSSASAS